MNDSCNIELYNGRFNTELKKLKNRIIGVSYVEEGISLILRGLKEDYGLDLSDVNLKDTPKRVARAYAEIFSGVSNTQEQVSEILSTAFPCENNSLVLARDIRCYGMCPHHLLPVEYRIDVGYIPTGSVIGISKLARLVEVLAARPVLQESLTKEITDRLTNDLKSSGSMCVTKGKHMCMSMRGVKSKNSSVVVSSISGVFQEDSSLRAEFLSLISH